MKCAVLSQKCSVVMSKEGGRLFLKWYLFLGLGAEVWVGGTVSAIFNSLRIPGHYTFLKWYLFLGLFVVWLLH